MNELNKKIYDAFQLFDNGEYRKAEQLYEYCLHKRDHLDINEYQEILHGIGYVKAYLKKFTEAQNCYKELLRIAKECGNIEDEAIALHQLGMVERMAENYSEALAFFNKELLLRKKYQLDHDLSLSAIFYEFGYIHFLINELDKAEVWMEKSLYYAQLCGDYVCLGCSYRGLGEIYKMNDDINRSTKSFNDAIHAFTTANDWKAVEEVKTLMET